MKKKILLALAIATTAMLSSGCPGGYECYWPQTCYDAWGYAYECGYYYECGY